MRSTKSLDLPRSPKRPIDSTDISSTNSMIPPVKKSCLANLAGSMMPKFAGSGSVDNLQRDLPTSHDVDTVSAYEITTEVIDDDALMVFASPLAIDPAPGLPSPPPSEARASPATDTKLQAPRGPPKQILDLPDKVLGKILIYVLVPPRLENETVRPFYKKGMLAGYIRTGNEIETNIGHEVTKNNIDIAQTMLVCNKFAELGREAFYGSAWFQFSDPDAFKWWLRHIGTKNLAHVRKLAITVYPGFTTAHAIRSVFDLSAEEKYLQAFQELRRKHKLHYLEVVVISRDYWGRSILIDSADHDEVHKYRQLLLDELLRYRNLRMAKLQDTTRFWGNREQLRQCSVLLCRKEDVERAICKPRTKRMSLARLMEEIRVNRELEEMASRGSVYYDDDYDGVYPASRQMSRQSEGGINTRIYHAQSRPAKPMNSLLSSSLKGKRANTYSRKSRRSALQHELFR
ncbi:uncharacterized protein A1O9_05563 [Exophiala aquamarina CBS 119918]|uniref:Uncharacterized protein n=1 Tax=Exophiala aquamarina CBS 119918 TaxID=1182545 RepID=A0A072PQ57_9EURO|nr:uncharacterized protein A1O9_05563 [Exophiala aquamarina CBS 119918]KEF57645.1 hypothetical protein A1O9_05563 [Exophiala aquamarina CBS 119918]